MVANKQKRNDPKRVDSLIGWAILIGFGGVTFFALCQNIGPYTSLFTSLVRQIPMMRWLPWVPAALGFIVGIGCLAAVQSAEMWPLLMLDTPSEARDEDWNRRIRTACTIACGGYAIDAAACAKFWPPLTVDFAVFRYAPTLSAIAWGNIAIAIFTLFGLAAYVCLWRYVRQVM
ncbi:MAG: hypothetical protein ACFB0G_10415 [Leptolyngbyaceae cyanobacterium]